MRGPIIHLANEFLPHQVHCNHLPSIITLPDEVTAAIESAWQSAKSRLGTRLYNGPMARLDSWRIENGHLHLQFTPTTYKHFLGTNLCHPKLADQFGPDILANPLGISALVETSDSYLLMGRRGKNVAFHAHQIHPLGGTIDNVTADPFTEIRRELFEEAALRDDDLLDLRCVGLAGDPAIRQPELMFHAKSNLPLSKITLDPAEHDALWSIRADPSTVAQHLQNASKPTPSSCIQGEGQGGGSAASEFTPIALAALKLWLRAH
jgi:hypothetical protein